MDMDMEANADIDVDRPDVTPLRTAAPSSFTGAPLPIA
jgi:hypothetical protein